MTIAEKMSNIEVADLLGLSHVQVSRIRSGQRKPGVNTMIQISRVFSWSMDDQAKARTADEYAAGFETALGLYASSRHATAVPVERPPAPQ